MVEAEQFGILALADISGYTAFSRMHITSLLHAEEIISELLEAVIGAARFPLKLGQLEGDAVLLYASVDPAERASAAHDVLRQMGRIFQAFTACERALIACDAGCVCEACIQIGQLKLKAVLHIGGFTLHQVQGVQELGGSEVKLLRQLIKAPLAAREYLLLTQPFYALSGPFQNRYPDQRLPLPALPAEQPALIYEPQLSASVGVPPGSGPAFSARLNKHSVARLLGRRRARFSNLPDTRISPLSSVRYVLEGTRSGVNILLRTLRGGRRRVPVLRQVVLGLLAIGWDAAWAEAHREQLDLDLLASALLTGVVGALEPPLLLNKLEGDVALLYAPSDGDLAAVAAAVDRLSKALVTAAWSALAQLAAQPGALPELGDAAAGLRVRLLLHGGEVAIKHIQQRQELAGSDVILIHRLLVAEAPHAASVLMTERFVQLRGGAPQPPADLLVVQTSDQDIVPLLAVDVPVPYPLPLVRPHP